ncbi:MAG: hypothetical protein ACR2MK_11325 [Solirubrobacteraceae bacterium]
MLLVGLLRDLGDRPRGHPLKQRSQPLLLSDHAPARLAPLACPGPVERAGPQDGVGDRAALEHQVEQLVAARLACSAVGG